MIVNTLGDWRRIARLGDFPKKVISTTEAGGGAGMIRIDISRIDGRGQMFGFVFVAEYANGMLGEILCLGSRVVWPDMIGLAESERRESTDSCLAA